MSSQAAVIGNVNELTKKHVNRGERIAFYGAAMMRDMGYAIMGFMTIFYYDIMGLPGAAVAILLLVGRIWDGISDPLIGIYVDKSVSSKGKAKPFFKKMLIPGAVLIVMLFYAPNWFSSPAANIGFKVAWAFMTRILYDTLRTLEGTCFMSHYSSISPNPDERNRVIATSRIASNIGSAIIGGAIPLFLGFFRPDDVAAKTMVFFGVGIFVSLAWSMYHFLMIKYVKERVIVVPKERYTVKQLLVSLWENKLLLLLEVQNILGGIVTLGSIGLWFWTYNMGNPALQTFIGIGGFPMLILAAWGAPKLIRKYEKRTLFLACQIANIVIAALFLVVGYQNLLFVIIITTIGAFPHTFRGILYWTMIAETVDFTEWRTGTRNEGMVYTAEGFASKIIGSISAIWIVIVVAAIGFVPNALTQSEGTLRGLFVIPRIVDIVIGFLCMIPICFYKYSRKDHEKVLLDLKSRRKTINTSENEETA
jgi:GPH family glycoside/pentoside/hexuronide:cation symporter/probable glucitol transport protein GutA